MVGRELGQEREVVAHVDGEGGLLHPARPVASLLMHGSTEALLSHEGSGSTDRVERQVASSSSQEHTRVEPVLIEKKWG